MIKKLLTFIFFMGLTIQFTHAKSVITYEDFVHMPFNQQVKTIKLVHDYLIEFEHQTLITKATLEQKRKYHSYMKIINFFMSSAYAAPKLPSGEKLCYYGGWISFKKDGRCVHPDRVNWDVLKKAIKRLDPNLQSYLKTLGKDYKKAKAKKAKKLTFKNGKFTLSESKSSCYKDKEIMCNQDIYGSDNGTPFCVSGNSNYGFNTSFLCNQALEVIKENDEEKYSKIMKEIVNKGLNSSRTNHFLYTLRAMYDTCLCGGANQKYFSGSVSPEYAKRMFPTRTCYGILNQTQSIYESINKNTSLSCKALSDNKVVDDRVATWSQFLSKAHNEIKDELNKYKNLSSSEFLESQMALDKVKEAQNSDENGSFGQIRNQSMKSYVKQGLCPLKDFMPDKPQLHLTSTTEGDKTKYRLRVTQLPPRPNINNWKIEIPDAPNLQIPEITVDPLNPYEATFELEHDIDPHEFEAFVQVNDDKPSTTGEVPSKEELPTLKLEYNEEDGTITAIVEKVRDQYKPEVQWPEITTDNQDAPAPAPQEFTDKNKDIKVIKVTKTDKPYKLKITAIAKNNKGEDITLTQEQEIAPLDKLPTISLKHDPKTGIATAIIENAPDGAKITDWKLISTIPEFQKNISENDEDGVDPNSEKPEDGTSQEKSDPTTKKYNVKPDNKVFKITATAKVNDKEIASNEEDIAKNPAKLNVTKDENNIITAIVDGIPDEDKEKLKWQEPKILDKTPEGASVTPEKGKGDEDKSKKTYKATPTDEDYKVEITVKLPDGTELKGDLQTIAKVEKEDSPHGSCSIIAESNKGDIGFTITIDGKKLPKDKKPEGYSLTWYKKPGKSEAKRTPAKEKEKNTVSAIAPDEEPKEDKSDKEQSETQTIISTYSKVEDKKIAPGAEYAVVLSNPEKKCEAHASIKIDAPKREQIKPQTPQVSPFGGMPQTPQRRRAPRRGYLIRGAQ